MGAETSADLDAALAAFIRGEGGDFDRLAMRLFGRQLRENDDYHDIVRGRGTDLSSWRDIPAVPVALWRDLALTSFPVVQTQTVFRTSGTTGRRGVVRRRDTTLYDLGSKRFAESVVGRLPDAGVSLVPDAKDSSLGHMVRTFAPRLRQRFSGVGGVDAEGAWSDLREATGPVFVPGTALALAELVARAGEPVPLVAGSVVMVTGGFKGRRMSVTAEGLRSELVRLLPGARVVEEYGMTELSSQMWAPGPGEPLWLPPWLRVVPVDPWTGEPVSGGVGLLRFVDLANADTVLAIETRDMGRLTEDGRLVLEARLAGSPARGCSLSVEEAMQGGPVLGASVRTDGPAIALADAQFNIMIECSNDYSADELNTRSREQQTSDTPIGLAADPHRARLETDRSRRVLAALQNIGPAEPSWGQGLHPDAATAELSDAIGRITAEGLRTELATVPPEQRPRKVAIVEAEGVFTAGLEWVALALAAGMQVHWKPPSAWPHFAEAVGIAFCDQGLLLTVDVSRDLGAPEVIVAFGSDAGVASVRADHPDVRVVAFGHRFSVAVVAGPPSAEQVAALVRDHVRFDTRGCMAPTAVWVKGPVEAWGAALHDALSSFGGPPRGEVDPRFGPEWRRRVDLGHTFRGAWTGAQHAVVTVPASAWVPVALPWLVSLVPIAEDDSLEAILGDWSHQISSVAGSGIAAPRQCALGDLQSPRFPRRHDGKPMLGALCGRLA